MLADILAVTSGKGSGAGAAVASIKSPLRTAYQPSGGTTTSSNETSASASADEEEEEDTDEDEDDDVDDDDDDDNMDEDTHLPPQPDFSCKPEPSEAVATPATLMDAVLDAVVESAVDDAVATDGRVSPPRHKADTATETTDAAAAHTKAVLLGDVGAEKNAAAAAARARMTADDDDAGACSAATASEPDVAFYNPPNDDGVGSTVAGGRLQGALPQPPRCVPAPPPLKRARIDALPDGTATATATAAVAIAVTDDDEVPVPTPFQAAMQAMSHTQPAEVRL